MTLIPGIPAVDGLDAVDAIDERSDRRRATGLLIGSALVSAIGVGALAYTATSAAFVGTTENAANSFGAATVSLTDDDLGSAMFNVADMLPGDTVSDCILVTYNGSSTDLDSLVLFGTSSGDLADDLDLVVRHGAAGASCGTPGALVGVYSGGLDSLGTDFASGSAGLTPGATGEAVPYLFDVTLDAATPNTAQGDTASASFTWEVRSN